MAGLLNWDLINNTLNGPVLSEKRKRASGVKYSVEGRAINFKAGEIYSFQEALKGLGIKYYDLVKVFKEYILLEKGTWRKDDCNNMIQCSWPSSKIKRKLVAEWLEKEKKIIIYDKVKI